MEDGTDPQGLRRRAGRAGRGERARCYAGCRPGREHLHEVHPTRFLECCISEAHLVNTAAGLSKMGFIPFLSSYSMFLAGRSWDQVAAQHSRAGRETGVWAPGPPAGGPCRRQQLVLSAAHFDLSTRILL
ncbi:hypothetical protein IT575_03595 [bacterium]|nr:hypothetical protein [bacterium]